MLSGNILDVYPDYKENAMIVWLTDNGRAERIKDSFEPSFFVSATRFKLYKLANILRDLSQVKTINFTKKKTILGSKKENGEKRHSDIQLSVFSSSPSDERNSYVWGIGRDHVSRFSLVS